MITSGWILLTLLSKVLIHLGTAGAIGGLFSLWLLRDHAAQRTRRVYLVSACALGFVATVSSYLVQVGAFADQGITGMFDLEITGILLQTGIGEASVSRLLGFILVTCAGLYVMNKNHKKLANFSVVLAMTGSLLLLWSYTRTGHLVDTGWAGQVLLAAHILAACLWLGSLYPLWHISRHGKPDQIQLSMIRFGQIAAGMVGVLLACGLLMSYLLLAEISHLFTTEYGQALLTKLFLVCAMLSLAALNKLWLVPRLGNSGHAHHLTYSITLEMVIGSLILLSVGYLTTYTGPA